MFFFFFFYHGPRAIEGPEPSDLAECTGWCGCLLVSGYLCWFFFVGGGGEGQYLRLLCSAFLWGGGVKENGKQNPHPGCSPLLGSMLHCAYNWLCPWTTFSNNHRACQTPKIACSWAYTSTQYPSYPHGPLFHAPDCLGGCRRP